MPPHLSLSHLKINHPDVTWEGGIFMWSLDDINSCLTEQDKIYFLMYNFSTANYIVNARRVKKG